MAGYEDINPEQNIPKVKRLKQMISSAYNYSQRFFPERLRFRKLYLREVEKERDPTWQAKTCNPLAFQSIEQKSSFCVKAFSTTDNKPLFKVLPWDNMEASKKALAHTRYLNYQLTQIKFNKIQYKAFKNAFIDGTSILKTYWDYQISYHDSEPIKRPITVEEARMAGLLNDKEDEDLSGSNYFHEAQEAQKENEQFPKPKFTQLNEEWGYIEIPQPPTPVEYRDSIGIKEIDICNFWPDPSSSGIEDGRFHIERDFISKEALLQYGQKMGLDIELIEKASKIPLPSRDNDLFNFNPSTSSYSSSLSMEERYRSYSMAADPKNPMMEVLYIHEPGVVSMFLQNEVLLDYRRPVYRSKYPFIRIANAEVSNQFFGISEFKTTESILTHLDKFQDMILDNYYLHLKGMTLVGGGVSNQAKEQLKRGEPSSVITVSDLEDIQFVRPDMPQGGVVNALSLLTTQARSSMGVEGVLSGESPGSGIRDSASFNAYTKIEQIRLSVFIDMMAEEYRDLAQQLVNLNKQFLNRKVRVRIGGKLQADDQIELDMQNPQDLPMNVDIDVELSSIANPQRDKELNQMMMFTQQFMGSPSFNVELAGLQMAQKIEGFEDSLDLFTRDPAVMMERAQLNAIAARKNSVDPAIAGALAPQMPGGSPMADQGGRPTQGNAVAPVPQ